MSWILQLLNNFLCAKENSNLKNRRTHFLQKDVYGCEILNLFFIIQLQDDAEAIGTYQCLCLLKAELNTKTAALLKFVVLKLI